MALSNACPKPEPRFSAKQRAKAAEAKRLRECYRDVDARDGHVCRPCRARVGGKELGTRTVHHHLVYRSQGGQHTTANVITICERCDDLIHREGKLHLSGNADKRNGEGRLCGVASERREDTTWRKGGMC
jgi:5-methylcytosine-specific restriction endonuclease McrA